MNSSSARPSPSKTEETVSHRQNNNAKEVRGTPPGRSNLLVYFANCCFNSCVEQSHKDNVRRATVEEQLKQRVVQLSEPSSTSLLLISPGLS